MIILPQLANMPMFADDVRLRMFKDGLWVGIFAPSQRQAQITYGRIKSRIQCKSAQAVMEDPEFRLTFTTSNGQTVALSNGSFATAISASDGSNIEGESFKLIICEECQDISNYKIQKSIHPMGAAYNATIVKIGTATTFKGDFYDAIQRNKRDYEAKTTHIRNHFEFDYKIASKYNPSYAKYVEKEKARLGEKSDSFRMSYCLEWIIERGMFIDIAKFEASNGESLLERVMYDKSQKRVDSKQMEFYDDKLTKLWVDIFVLDALPEGKISKPLTKLMHCIVYGLALGHRYEIKYSDYQGIMKVFVGVLSNIGKLIPFKITYKIWKWLCVKDAKANTSLYFFSNYLHVEMKKEEHDNVKTVPFETEEFYIPEGWEHYLVQVYGDYMKLPPVEKQVLDHSDMEIIIYE